MSVEFEMRKWCAIVKLEGYTTPASARALVQKFHNIVESFRDEGVDLDVFMLVGICHSQTRQDEGKVSRYTRALNCG